MPQNRHDALRAEAIFSNAVRLMQQRGFSEVTFGDIAEESKVGVDEVFRFFPTKERLITRLYEHLAGELEEIVAELPAGTVAERAKIVLRRKLELLRPHLTLFRPLVAAALDPNHRLAILGRDTDRIRHRVQSVFQAAAAGASDAPTPSQLPGCVRMLYALHLACVGLLIQDQSDDGELTSEATELFADLVLMATRFQSRSTNSMLNRMISSTLRLPDLSAMSGRVERILERFIEPSHDSTHFDLAETILRDLFRYRRMQTGFESCAKNPCSQCLSLHLPRVQSAIAANAPIHLVLPAFPAKSANRQKTLGSLPDLGEELALRFLQERCDEIRSRYQAGAKITICSDGRVFNDLVGVSDDEVGAYRRHLIAMIERLGLDDIDVFDLDDVWPNESHESARQSLMNRYAESMETLLERTKQFPHHQQLFNGIHRFLTEDLADREPELSRNQARNRSKEAAYEVVRRSNAWSKLVAQYFPDSLRLSIHPQPSHSEKIGIMLVPAEDVWLTPWHSAVLLEEDRFRLMHRVDAEACSGRLILVEDRPSHFEIGTNRNSSRMTEQP